MPVRKLTGCCFILLTAVWANHGVAADWPRFRGPNGSGVSSDETAVPTSWGESENLKWKVALPGPGSSSPIVIGDKVFITCWSGYGVDRADPGAPENLKRHLICLDRTSGETIWDRAVKAELPEDNYRGMFTEHGYATHTPASDGEHIYVFFGKTGVLAFDLKGNQLWQTKVGSELDPRGWGSASSPILYRNLVIVTASAESEALVALDKQTGQEVWRQKAGGIASTWGTPILVELGEDRTDLVLGVPYEIWGINPETGKLRWYCEATGSNSFCSSVVADGGVVYAIEGQGGGSVAVRAGGSGDVTKTHLVWSGQDRNRIGTPVIDAGRIYFISRNVINCVDAKNGNRIYQARLTAAAGDSEQGGGEQDGSRRRGGFGGGGGGQDYASPVIADGKLYYVSRSGDASVVKLGPEFEQLAANRMSGDSEDFSATPAVSDGELFVRSSKHLYCISEQR